MKINCRYVNSQGLSINFLGEKARVTSGTVHGREWKPSVTTGTIGETVDYWSKEAYRIPLTITFRGTKAERLKEMDRLHDMAEYDIIHNSAGTLYYGEWFCNCFISAAVYEAGELPTWIDNKITIYVPEATWWKKSVFKIDKKEDSGIVTKYPTLYPFRYGNEAKVVTLDSDHFTESDFRMIVYGPANNVNVQIAENVYKVNHEILAGEYMVIDTRTNQRAEDHCYIVRQNGTKINCYNDRETDIMVPVPPGKFNVNYSRQYTIEIQMMYGRSEPKWYQ